MNLIASIGISILGLLFAKIMLGSMISNAQKKKKFMFEYLDVINNPKYQVRKNN